MPRPCVATFTVFAPTNEAFQQLPQGGLDQLDQQQLQMLLQHHVIEGEQIASDEIPEVLEPMAGGRIDVSLAGDEILLYSAPPVGQQGQQQGQQVQQQLQQVQQQVQQAEQALQQQNTQQAEQALQQAQQPLDQAMQQAQGQQATGAMATGIERVRVVEGDIEADNGVIHTISGVLVPPDMEQALR